MEEILKMEKRKTQSNELNDSDIVYYAQSVTLKRWHRISTGKSDGIDILQVKEGERKVTYVKMRQIQELEECIK